MDYQLTIYLLEFLRISPSVVSTVPMMMLLMLP